MPINVDLTENTSFLSFNSPQTQEFAESSVRATLLQEHGTLSPAALMALKYMFRQFASVSCDPPDPHS